MLERAQQIIDAGIERGLHIGGQLYVSRDGKTVADLAFGLAREGVAMTPDTIMLWMSSTKPITPIAIAQMWERGKLSLDDRVEQHIPGFGAKGKSAITIRHVLTHTAGFRAAVGPWTADPWDKIIANICDAELEPGWVVGRTSGYHVASGWYILGEIVRRLDPEHRPYSRYLREEVLEPLGMRDTFVGMPTERWREYGDERIAPMHFAATFKRPQPHRYWPWSNSAEAVAVERPGGNGRGPIHDLGRFYEAMLAGGAGVVRPQTVEAICARHTVGLPDKTFGVQLDRGLGVVLDGKQYGAASGWYGTRCSPRTWGHAGYVCSVGFLDPENRLVVAMVFNGMTEAEPPLHDERVRETIDSIYEELAIPPLR
ncbi:MAG TPA: serine hydrolase domain-containing protein [Candidatus Acidoferrales bacterium]|nr:serine hydrolase domain-containing protein [Candidatus Acidoferrales bacterium]